MSNEKNKAARKNKATHTGTCQCCGATQKLPGGVLSLHGYTVDWGFFNGVCQGTGYLPYELSCGLIETFIKHAEASLARIDAERVALLAPATSPLAWINHYTAPTYQNKNGYRWIQAEIIEKTKSILQKDAEPYTFAYFVYMHNDKECKIETYGAERQGGLLGVASVLNERRAAVLAKQCEEIRTYIAWQQRRVTEWKLADLKPIK